MRVLITRPREEAEEFAAVLATINAEAVIFPTIQIAPIKDPGALDEALRNLSAYDWVIFTSSNAVEAVVERLEQLQLSIPAELRVAAVGPKTAAQLEAYGFAVHFVPDEYIAEAVASGLGDLAGLRVLLPLADIAHDTLPKAINAGGGEAHIITAYHTVPESPDPQGMAALRSGVEVITFTSGSTARNFASLVKESGLDVFNLPGSPVFACIGPKTAAAARELGFQVDIVAEKYTIEGLAQAIDAYQKKVRT